jgi:putative Ca2+/H+ antiporter (TMEM165/GDT1 family)
MYSLVLVSELGDKSQIAILALAASSIYPILIFLGAFLGFLAVNATGAFIGDRISEALPVDLIRKATGVLFILFGILIFLNII